MKKWWKERQTFKKLFCIIIKHQIVSWPCRSSLLLVDFDFPLLLVVVNILPIFRFQFLIFLKVVNEFLPDTMYDVVTKIITKYCPTVNGLLSFAVLSALWPFQIHEFLQKAFNKAYGVAKNRGWFLINSWGLFVSFGLQILFALALFLSVFGRMLLNLSKLLKSIVLSLITCKT